MCKAMKAIDVKTHELRKTNTQTHAKTDTENLKITENQARTLSLGYLMCRL